MHHGLMLTSGFASGVVATGLLNPVDRALFLSVSERRPFLDARNWRQPYQGLGQAIVGRAISTGLWFPLERIMLQLVTTDKGAKPSALTALLAGQAAGVTNAVLLSPLNYVKYKTWGQPDSQRTFIRTATQLYQQAGTASILLRGLPTTCVRDGVFGGCFSWLRRALRSSTTYADGCPPAGTGGAASCDAHGASPAAAHGASPAAAHGASPAPAHGATPLSGFVVDCTAAGVATALSAPFNYARNVQFAADASAAAPTMRAAITELATDVRQQRGTMGRLRTLSQRLNIGWGTLRVAGGMGLSAWLFESILSAAEALLP